MLTSLLSSPAEFYDVINSNPGEEKEAEECPFCSQLISQTKTRYPRINMPSFELLQIAI